MRLTVGHTNAGHGIGVMLVVLLVAMAVPAVAQDVYDLGPEGWERQERPDPDSPEGQLRAARQALAADKGERAEKLLTEWIERYPNHPLRVEAILLRGDAKTQRRHYFRALFDYEKVIRDFPASPQFHTALERELKIAGLFSKGVKRRFWGMRLLTAYAESEELMIRIQERAPGSEIGEKASIALGDYYFDRAKMSNAAQAYALFLENYPRSQRREHAMLRLIQANLARFKGPRFDATGLVEAAERLKMFREAYPAAAEKISSAALLVRIEESLAKKLLYDGDWYQQRGETVSAVYLYQRTITDHPATDAARAAIRRLKAIDEPYATIPGAEAVEAAVDKQPETAADDVPATEAPTEESK